MRKQNNYWWLSSFWIMLVIRLNVLFFAVFNLVKKGKRKVHRVPQSQTAALPRHQEEEETDILFM